MNKLDIAKRQLLDPAEINESQLIKILSQVLGYKVDYADMYFQAGQYESWTLEDGIVKQGSYSSEKGVGVRALSGEKSGFAYTDEIILPALEDAAKAARSISNQGQSHPIKIVSPIKSLELYQPINPFSSLQEAEKIQILHRINEYARQLDSRVSQVVASLNGVYETIMILNSEGELAADIRPLVRLNVSVVAQHQGKRESASAGGGGRFDYQFFLENDRMLHYADEAVRQALLNLDAVNAPAGAMPVVLGPGWPAVLLHEAIGHGLEGDFNRKGSSAFSNRLGEKVANPLCTIVDDGTLAKRRGSLNIDDEGTPAHCTTLIENGILTNYMQDKLNARLMKMKPTGNGRRESYAHLPMPRMTNTYMLPGPHDKNEIISSVKKGIYAVNFAGGQVDITSGKFVFTASEAYLIEEGKVTKPLKGVTLIGNGPDVLTRVSMVGNDLELDSGIGTCGKDGQSVPVGVGQPTLKIDEIIVGGTEKS